MKRVGIVLILGFLGIRAAEILPPAIQESAGFLEQIRQAVGGKSESSAEEEVRPVVDAAADAEQQAASDLQGADDFDFETESPGFFEESNAEREELSGEGMSEHFADVGTETVEGLNP